MGTVAAFYPIKFSICPIKFSIGPIKSFRKSLLTAKTSPLNARKVKQDRLMLCRGARQCKYKIAAVAVLVSLRRTLQTLLSTSNPHRARVHSSPAWPAPRAKLGQLCAEKHRLRATAPLLRLLSLRAAISFSACAHGSASFECSFA